MLVCSELDPLFSLKRLLSGLAYENENRWCLLAANARGLGWGKEKIVSSFFFSRSLSRFHYAHTFAKFVGKKKHQFVKKEKRLWIGYTNVHFIIPSRKLESCLCTRNVKLSKCSMWKTSSNACLLFLGFQRTWWTQQQENDKKYDD